MKVARRLFAATIIIIAGALRAEGQSTPTPQDSGSGTEVFQYAPAGAVKFPSVAFGPDRDTGFYLRGDGGIGVVLSGSETFSFDRQGALANSGLILPKVDPHIVTCPVSNCPRPNSVLSAMDIYGQTTRGARTPEWESVVGLFSATGDPGGQKVVQYLGGMQAPGAGALWTLNTDVVRNALPGGRFSISGSPGSGMPGKPGGIGRVNSTIGYELDLTNWSEDDAPGGPFVVGMFINTLSSYSSLAGIYYGSAREQKIPSWHNGIFFAANTIKDNSVFDNSSASFSYQVSGSHRAAFYDNSNSQTGLFINGAHAVEDILLSDQAPVGIAINGNHNTAAITVRSGQRVCFDTNNSCVSYDTGRRGWSITDLSGKRIAAIDDDGNMILKGKVIQNGEP